jgi:hypothetical protein
MSSVSIPRASPLLRSGQRLEVSRRRFRDLLDALGIQG